MSLREKVLDAVFHLPTYPATFMSDTTYIADRLGLDRVLILKELNKMHKEGLIKKSYEYTNFTLIRWGRKGERWRSPDASIVKHRKREASDGTEEAE